MRTILKAPWKRIVGESVLIIASVYVAIFLEGISSDRQSAAAARTGLVQLRAELVADREDLGEIMEEQRGLSLVYHDLASWLVAGDDMPFDKVDAALKQLELTNRTLFPRKGAWTSLVASAQLLWIRDQALVTRLGNFYENIDVRLEYSGAAYDYNVNEVLRHTVSAVWDKHAQRPTGDLVQLRNELLYVENAHNKFYLGLLQQYEIELNDIIEAIDRHLGAG
jgi:hypothetical protein